MSYELPPGYRSRLRPIWNDHTAIAESGVVYQQEVYDLAQNIACRHGVAAVLDVGCGYAEKAAGMGLIPIGIDIETNIEVCRKEYPQGTWIAANLEGMFPAIELDQKTVVVCADVLEHLVNPEVLLHGLAKFALNPLVVSVVISTPDRSRMKAGKSGPPANRTHVREWNSMELARLLNRFRFSGDFQINSGWVFPRTGVKRKSTMVFYWERIMENAE